MNRQERRKREAEERAQSRRLIIPGSQGWVNADVPDDFDAFFDDLRNQALPPNDGDPPLHVWAINAKSRRFLELTPPAPGDMDGKNMVANAIRRILRDFGATRVAVIMEAWMGRQFARGEEPPSMRPSEDPLRTEILSITAEDVSGRTRNGWFQIERKPDGTAYLGEWCENDRPGAGRLSGLLQPEPHGTVQ